MKKIGIIIQREYTTRVRKKSFIILTFLMPLLFIGLIGGTFFLSTFKDDTTKNILVIDETNKYFSSLKDTGTYTFIDSKQDKESTQPEKNRKVYATLIITQDLLENPSAITLYSDKQITGDIKKNITSQLNEFLKNEKLASYNIPYLKDILEELNVSIQLQSIRLDEAGNEQISSSEAASVTGIIFTLIIYMFIFVYGGMVMQGVLEEKTNRIVEVIISSVKPFDLMMGKIIGIGLVGLTQFLLWGILISILNLFLIFLFSFSFLNGEAAGIGMINPDINTFSFIPDLLTGFSSINFVQLILFFILFFIGGYIIYASIFAAIGSIVNNQEDTQQFMLPVTLLVLFALYAGIYSLDNPDGPLAFWTSLIPLTSPIVMMTRLPFYVPAWELILSLILLYLTAFFLVKLSAKIYRTGILMYGKKPALKEIFKWLKY